MSTRRGWSLLELIVALAILAVLLSITIPALRGVAERSQTTKNLANMSLTMKDFFVWSNQHNGRMVNKGVPQPSKHYGYMTQDRSWPSVLYEAFGSASPHWQSTYSNPEEWLFGQMTLAEARRLDPTWEWRIPSDFLYSPTMLTKPIAWQFPGLALPTKEEFAKYYAFVQLADIAHASNKGVLWHDFVEAGPGRQRLVAFADGAVSQRDILEAKPSASHPMSDDPTERFGPIVATLKGAEGIDF